MFIFCQDKNDPSEHEQYAIQMPMELSLKDQERLRERLREEMQRRGIGKQYEMAALLGITPTYLSAIFGRKRIGSRRLVDFAKRLKVPVGYLLGLENYQDWWVLRDDYVRIPRVKNIAAHPAGEIPGGAVAAWLWLNKADLHGRGDLVAYRLGAEADSMLPLLQPGDTVVIDRRDREITPRALYAVLLPDLESATVKRLHPVPGQNFVTLISENPAYPPETVEWHEHLLLGRVVWSWTNWVR